MASADWSVLVLIFESVNVSEVLKSKCQLDKTRIASQGKKIIIIPYRFEKSQ